MTHSTEIIVKLKNALSNGRIRAEEIPIQDLKECVRLEIETNRMTYTEEQYGTVKDSFESFCSYVYDGEKDPTKAGMFLDGMLICLASVSEAVLSLANQDYWTYMHRDRMDDPEVREIVEYVGKSGCVRLLNYEFVRQYEELEQEVGFDEECGLSFVIYKGHRMYFPRRMDEWQIREYYNTILAEQDPYSPHCYRKTEYEVKTGDVIVDMGAAEGFWALDHLEEAAQIHIFDADADWIEALRKTFEQEAEKVHIHYGYVGDVSDGDKYITLDEVLNGIRVNYLKMDIEGYEKAALAGAEQVISESKDMRCAICTYHCREDEEYVRDFLEKRGFETAHSRGYMCPDWQAESLLNAELRRGVMFGRKNA